VGRQSHRGESYVPNWKTRSPTTSWPTPLPSSHRHRQALHCLQRTAVPPMLYTTESSCITTVLSVSCRPSAQRLPAVPASPRCLPDSIGLRWKSTSNIVSTACKCRTNMQHFVNDDISRGSNFNSFVQAKGANLSKVAMENLTSGHCPS
jgi:hypothetical protein